MAFVLATSGGPHPADKWGVVSAEEIVDLSGVDADRFKDRMLAARSFQNQVAAILTRHHGSAQADEKALLAASAGAHYAAPLAGALDADAIVAEIQAAAADTPWAANYQADGTVQFIRAVVAHHAGALRLVERHWHAHRNPSHDGHAHLAAHGQAAAYGQYLPPDAPGPDLPIQNA